MSNRIPVQTVIDLLGVTSESAAWLEGRHVHLFPQGERRKLTEVQPHESVSFMFKTSIGCLIGVDEVECDLVELLGMGDV